MGFDDLPEARVLHPAADHGPPGLRGARPARDGAARAGARGRGARLGRAGADHARRPRLDGAPARFVCGLTGFPPLGVSDESVGAALTRSHVSAHTTDVSAHTLDPDAVVIGVDFGTLSGRAVVVRVSRRRRARLRGATTTRTRVLDRDAARHAAHRCRPTGPCRCPRTTSTCCATPCRPPSRTPGSTRPRSSASPPTSPPARWCRRPPTAPRCASSRVRRPTRTPTSSSGGTTPPRRRPTGSTSSPRKRGEAWLARYGGLISSEWEFAKGLQLLEEAPRGLRRDGALGRGGRLDRLAAVRQLRAQRLHAPATRASARTARYPTRDFLAALNPGFADFVDDKLDAPDRPARAPAPAR